jgi:hypothetical protein
MFNGSYTIPVDGDKVFRSPKHGQKELRAIKGVARIWVDNRDNAVTQDGIKIVKITITAYNEAAAKACFQKGNQMIKAILSEKESPTEKQYPTEKTTSASTSSSNNGPYTGCYCVPVDADKVFRSPKCGQAQLKKNHRIQRIKVDDRDNSQKNAAGVALVRVWITAPTQDIADACYQEGRQLVIALMEKAKKEATKTPQLSEDEIFSNANESIKKIIQFREERGEYDHMDDKNVRWFIEWREDIGITNHAELGMTDYEDPRPTLDFDYPLDDWGDYHEKLYEFQLANPDSRIIG